MTETIDTAKPEALRLASWLRDRQSHLGPSRFSLRDPEVRAEWDDYDKAAIALESLHSALAAAEARNATLTDDAARLDFMCNKPARFIDVEDGGWWRVYEDQAPPEAPVAAWRAIVTKHEQTPREAIDAAIQARAAASISTKGDGP